MSPVGDRCLGKITESRSSTKNLLKSPFFHQISPLNYEFNSGSTNLVDYKQALCYGISSSGSSASSSSKLQQNLLVTEHHSQGFSKSSTNSTWSDQSSCSLSTATTRGMLHCSWKAGLPHYVFTVDELSEVYVASLCEAKSPEDRDLDYFYEFRLEANDNDESYLAGKMKVNSSIILDSSNSEVMETEFVLFGSNDDCWGEKQIPGPVHRKNKGLSKTVVEVFKNSRSSMLRSLSKFGGLDDDLPKNLCTNLDTNDDISETQFVPNFELAAIVVRENVGHEKENGGWGLKFLKKISTKTPNSDLETSVDIVVPAGFHGGPRTRNGGPSSLVERWKSNGICDCGGWDIGCPLKVLKTYMQKDCESLDLCIKGTEEGAPLLMKLMNVRDDSYFVHFESTLSALQCLSIAVAIIHSRTPSLSPREYRA